MWDAESIKNANATMHHYFFFLGDFNPSETWPFLKPKCIYLGPFYITKAHDSLAPAMGPGGPATLAFITTVLSATWQHHAHAVVEHQNGCKERHAQHPVIVPERPRSARMDGGARILDARRYVRTAKCAASFNVGFRMLISMKLHGSTN